MITAYKTISKSCWMSGIPKNGGMTTKDVSYGSHKKVWWQCEKGHEWTAVIANRTAQESGCPFCYPWTNKKVLVRQLELVKEAKEKMEKQN